MALSKKHLIIIGVFSIIQILLFLDILLSTTTLDNNVTGFIMLLICIAVAERDYIKFKKTPERKKYRKISNKIVLILVIIFFAFSVLGTGVIKARQEKQYNESIRQAEQAEKIN